MLKAMQQGTTLAIAGLALTILSGYKTTSSGDYLPTFFCPNYATDGYLVTGSDKYLQCFNDCQNYQLSDKFCDSEGSNNLNRGVPKALADAYANSFADNNARYIQVQSTIDGQSVFSLKDQFIQELEEGVDNRNHAKFTAYDFRKHNFQVTKDDAYLDVTFINETASLASSFGYFTFKVENGIPVALDGTPLTSSTAREKLNEVIIFPNYSVKIGDPSEVDGNSIERKLGSEHSLQTGQTAVIGPFPKDTWVGFFIITGGYSRDKGVAFGAGGWTYQLGSLSFPINSEDERKKYDFFETHTKQGNSYGNFFSNYGNWVFYSLKALNNELSTVESAHSIVLGAGSASSNNIKKNYYLLGFEDYSNSYPDDSEIGDKDYNDLIIMVQSDSITTGECLTNDCTCGQRDPATPANLFNKTYLDLGGSENDWDGDGIPNDLEASGQYCQSASPATMCFDPALSDISGVTKQAANRLLFHDASTTMVNNAALTTSGLGVMDGLQVFGTQYSPTNYTGEVQARTFDASSSIAAWTQSWLASANTPSVGQRKLYFTSENVAQLKLFKANQITAESDKQVLVRGFQSGEVIDDALLAQHVNFHRSQKIGAIYNSAPVYVGTPSQYEDTLGYLDFIAQNSVPAQRDAHVFVASNNGKLHALKADSGKETFAFIPKAVFPKLHLFKEAPDSSQMLNDGQISVADIYDSTTQKWKTVLVGLLGGAGKGAYALDVTAAIRKNSSAKPELLWEVSSEDLKMLGYTFGKPLIVKAEMASNQHRWLSIFGSGYRGQGNSNFQQAGLIAVDMFSGKILFIPMDEPVQEGLAAASAVDIDGNDLVDTVYIGSLTGQLWKVNLKDYSFSSAQVTVATKLDTPLFKTIAKRPITIAPTVLRVSKTKQQIIFGTGQYFETGDEYPTSTDTDYVYSLQVDSATTSVQSSELVEQKISHQTLSGSGDFSSFRVLENSPVNYAAGTGQKKGWYLPLKHKLQSNGAGERMIEPATYVEGLSRAFGEQKGGIILSTLLISAGNNRCYHTGWLMALDPFTAKPVQGVDFLNDGVQNIDMVEVSPTEKGAIAGGKLEGRISSVSNLAGSGRDENKFMVNGEIKQINTLDKASGRQNWRILETEQ